MAGKNKKKKGRSEAGVFATNRKAPRDYEILERLEAGVVLTGTEVKAIRAGKVSIQEGYVQVDDNLQAWLIGCTVQPYEHGNIFNHTIDRERKLLLHRKEIIRLHAKVREKGLTIVPLRLYLSHGKIKLKIGLGRGKNVVDKRDTIIKRQSERDSQRAMRNHNR